LFQAISPGDDFEFAADGFFDRITGCTSNTKRGKHRAEFVNGHQIVAFPLACARPTRPSDHKEVDLEIVGCTSMGPKTFKEFASEAFSYSQWRTCGLEPDNFKIDFFVIRVGEWGGHMLMECDDLVTIHKFCSMLPAFVVRGASRDPGRRSRPRRTRSHRLARWPEQK